MTYYNPIKRIGTIDVDKLLKELEDIKMPSDGTRQYQFPFQRKEHESDTETAKGTNFAMRADEFDFNTLMYPDKYPYMNSIITKYGMLRTREMFMAERYVYTWHIDTSPRIHIPLVTSENCMWIIRDPEGIDRIYRIPADGGVYLVDTIPPHTFLNSNDNDADTRIHIVGAVGYDYDRSIPGVYDGSIS